MKKLAILVAGLFVAAPTFAQENKQGWQVELKKLALDLTSNEVKHAKEYKEFPSDQLTSDSQTVVRGEWDSLADYYAKRFVWTNRLFMEYGRTKIRPVDAATLLNENADTILVQTGYTQRIWKVNDFLGGFEVGPFVNVGYQTEFTKTADSPRSRVWRGTAGMKLFDGKYLKKFYVAAVGEHDMTYKPHSNKSAWETLLEVEAPVREGVTFKGSAYFRDYLSSSKKYPTDLSWEFSADARLDVQLYKNLFVAPFISYYTAKGKYIAVRGENVYIGVSFSFSHIFHEAK